MSPLFICIGVALPSTYQRVVEGHTLPFIASDSSTGLQCVDFVVNRGMEWATTTRPRPPAHRFRKKQGEADSPHRQVRHKAIVSMGFVK